MALPKRKLLAAFNLKQLGSWMLYATSVLCKTGLTHYETELAA